jgi:hypothetical protein
MKAAPLDKSWHSAKFGGPSLTAALCPRSAVARGTQASGDVAVVASPLQSDALPAAVALFQQRPPDASVALA